MADKEKSSPDGGSQASIAEKRRDKRYLVPDACRQYITLRVKSRNEFAPAVLGNFSRNGILFESPVSFRQGEHAECFISVSLLLSREISFGIEVKYCYAGHGSYITGASINEISDESWFDVFVEVHDFIAERQGAG